MNIARFGFAAAFVSLAVHTALAEDSGAQEIVVTASRYESYEDLSQPHVTIRKRPDFALVSVEVVCDTREAGPRRTEIRNTLQAMVRQAAATPNVQLAYGEDIVFPLTADAIERAIRPDGRRADTSMATLLLKTPIGADDSFDSATDRLTAFVEKVKPVGRSEVDITGEWQLSLVNPGQYRTALISEIAKDAAAMTAAFGEDYRVQITGLQRPIAWQQSDALELTLFIPHDLTLTPAD